MKKITTLLLSLFTYCLSQAQLQYRNPILSGFYPDPSICRAGSDYYLVNSSFAYYPGLPIFHSKDLVNWKQVGHVLNRPSQLNLDGAGVSRGLFAPAISYYNNKFYLVCTLIDKGGNFIVTADRAEGPWSDPVWLPQVNGIDPSLFFDTNGKAYILFNSIPPGNQPLYDGHRSIRMFELDIASLKVTGEEKLLVNGGTDISKKPVWIEGPHIFQKDGWYYLICAEGGTGYQHSEVVFRSKTVSGPYESYAGNPILTQRHLSRSRPNPITTTGHADFVQAPGGEWFAVFLGCRPYQGDHYNIGRETFMAPVQWKNDWPVILEGTEEVKYHYPVPAPALTKKINNPYNGNIQFRDDFSSSSLNPRWVFLRTVRDQWHSLTGRKGWLSIKARPEPASAKVNPSFVAFRQQNLECTASTALVFNAADDHEKAGLIIFQNETHFYYLARSVEKDQPVVQLFQSMPDSSMKLLASVQLPDADQQIKLRIQSRDTRYLFSYAVGNNDWTMLKEDADARFLSTQTAGGFVGSVFALYAVSAKTTNSVAFYDWFDYKGEDTLFKK